jgi:hypothetical protein
MMPSKIDHDKNDLQQPYQQPMPTQEVAVVRLIWGVCHFASLPGSSL